MSINTFKNVSIPTEQEQQISVKSSMALAEIVSSCSDTNSLELTIEYGDKAKSRIEVPTVALQYLAEILAYMARGQAVTLVPIQAELTTQQCADLLGVSRPYFVKCLESGAVPFHKVGRHRRVKFADLMAYKQQQEESQSQALDELVQLAQELEMGYS